MIPASNTQSNAEGDQPHERDGAEFDLFGDAPVRVRHANHEIPQAAAATWES